ncbi:hypothetical protein [Saccharopolyspora rosea]|uniref:Uncharacterized protein n=1 Tax=Saccharopolyspora rosea TaxID=524884 RepID=A0ABW3FT13_9PSEU|nr:hypothetical protein [Saccharopolyspora rosea]
MQQMELSAESAELLPTREALGSLANVNVGVITQINVPTVVNLGDGNCIAVPSLPSAGVGQSAG